MSVIYAYVLLYNLSSVVVKLVRFDTGSIKHYIYLFIIIIGPHYYIRYI